jgi:hypothetical protein
MALGEAAAGSPPRPLAHWYSFSRSVPRARGVVLDPSLRAAAAPFSFLARVRQAASLHPRRRRRPPESAGGETGDPIGGAAVLLL